MILALDVGNTQIYGGVYQDGKLLFNFRKVSKSNASSDELGLFLIHVLRENNFNPNDIKEIGFCSVVPDVVHSLKNCCLRYFKKAPFALEAGVKTGLKIKYRNPIEVGADRIANSIAAIKKYPNQNMIIIDFGTATTFCAVTKDKEYLGGTIIPGLRISMEALEQKTAKLPSVEIVKPEACCARSTIESIQAGLFFGNIGMVKEITQRISQEVFKNEKPLIIGTGGFSRMFADENLFDQLEPDLVLNGIYQAIIMNK